MNTSLVLQVGILIDAALLGYTLHGLWLQHTSRPLFLDLPE